MKKQNVKIEFNGNLYDRDLIVSYMRDDLREKLHSEWTDLFKANLVKPAWTDNAKETEIPFVVHAIDTCIGTNWREDGNNDEQLFSNSDCSRPGHGQVQY